MKCLQNHEQQPPAHYPTKARFFGIVSYDSFFLNCGTSVLVLLCQPYAEVAFIYISDKDCILYIGKLSIQQNNRSEAFIAQVISTLEMSTADRTSHYISTA